MLYNIINFLFPSIIRNIKKDIKEDNIIIPKILSFNEYDKDSKLLREIIDNIKVEQWEHTIVANKYGSTIDDKRSQMFHIDLISHDKKVKINSAIRVYYEEVMLSNRGSVVSFNFKKDDDISFDFKSDNNKDIILDFLLPYVYEFKKEESDRVNEKYKDTSEKIRSGLKGINRRDRLNKILNKK